MYRMSSHNGVANAALRAYATDLRGHLARHSQAVLAER